MLVAFSFCTSCSDIPEFTVTTYEIDGERFSPLEEFFNEIDRVMHPRGMGTQSGRVQRHFAQWIRDTRRRVHNSLEAPRRFTESAGVPRDGSSTQTATAAMPSRQSGKPFRDTCRMPSKNVIKRCSTGWWISFVGTGPAAARRSRIESNSS